MKWIVESYDVSAEQPVGGKARALASAQAAGLPVPAFFVVLLAAFDHSRMEADSGRERGYGDDSRATMVGVTPSKDVSEAIDTALEAMCTCGRACCGAFVRA